MKNRYEIKKNMHGCLQSEISEKPKTQWKQSEHHRHDVQVHIELIRVPHVVQSFRVNHAVIEYVSIIQNDVTISVNADAHVKRVIRRVRSLHGIT